VRPFVPHGLTLGGNRSVTSARVEPAQGLSGQQRRGECGECGADEQAEKAGVPERVDGPVVRQDD
jgi:hypothetical protein